MAYLNPGTITVDAILTRKGRECLAKGDGSFNITQFALSDDEVNYQLYDVTHTSGSAYYGQAIEQTPILQAFVNENQCMKYKLVTLPKGTTSLPFISLGIGDISIRLQPGESYQLSNVQTLHFLGNNSAVETNGYVATVADSTLVTITGGGINGTTTAETIGNSQTVSGKYFTLTANSVATTGTTSLTVIGKDSGARYTIPVSVNTTSNSNN